ncbi:MAG TPA: substrate-binding domain-containing protein, partial [Candidatus Limnocylindrales bacterium]|nr:substrate-binding domain-containing protein [Candidatus Limnocylindrales bacterium]
MGRSFSARSLARVVTTFYAAALLLGVIIVQPGCVTVVMWTSQEKYDLLRDVAARYALTRPAEDLRCVRIDVQRVASGEAEESLARSAGGAGMPDIWSPAARSWLRLLERDRALAGAPSIVPSAETSILQSPLVIGMPQPMAAALGWPRADISWSDIFALARDPQGWAARGHAEWGRFKLAKTNPLISTSGLHALVATYLRSGGSSVDDPQVLAFMKTVESSVVHYSNTVSSFLLNLAESDDRDAALTYVSAIAMEEKQVWDYNQGNPESKTRPTRLPPSTKLVAIYPSEGTLLADHPFVVLPWADRDKTRAAGHFLDHLKSDAVQTEFLSVAFRGARGETGRSIDESTELN